MSLLPDLAQAIHRERQREIEATLARRAASETRFAPRSTDATPVRGPARPNRLGVSSG